MGVKEAEMVTEAAEEATIAVFTAAPKVSVSPQFTSASSDTTRETTTRTTQPLQTEWGAATLGTSIPVNRI